MKNICFISFFLCFLFGCQRVNKVDYSDSKPIPSQGLNAGVVKLFDTRKKIEKSTTEIDKSVDEIKKEATASPDKFIDWDLLNKNADNIKTENNNIKDQVKEIGTVATDVQKSTKDVKALETKIISLQKENDQVRADAIKNLYAYLGWIFGLAFAVIIGGAVVAFFVNKKAGMVLVGVGMLGIALAAGAIFYLKTLAAVGIYIIVGTILACIGYVIWLVKQEVTKKVHLVTANEENVTVIDQLKKELAPEVKEKYFGTSEKEGIVHLMQSDTTKDIVSEIRNK